jgi:hypothetical protein
MPPQQAIVTSVDALEAFRSNLINYLSKARPALEEVSADINRLKNWLQSDQRRLWENELRKRGKKLEEKKNELFTAKMSNLADSTSVQFLAKQRAEREVNEAMDKMTMLKKWGNELEGRADPLLRQVEGVHDFMMTEMPKAVVYLTQIIRSLEAYADVPKPGMGVESNIPAALLPPKETPPPEGTP